MTRTRPRPPLPRRAIGPNRCSIQTRAPSPTRQNQVYAVIHPALFCGIDQVGTCQALVEQLAQRAPGWGTTILDGPVGYGVYLTYQAA